MDTHAEMFSQVTVISRATDDPKCVCLVHNIPLANCSVCDTDLCPKVRTVDNGCFVLIDDNTV